MKLKGIFFSIIFGIMLVSVLFAFQQKTLANGEDSPKLNSVDNVALKAIFHIQKNNVEIDSFKVINQIAGYDKLTQPIFDLEGIMGPDKNVLYDRVDKEYHGTVSKYPGFDVDVYLTQGDFKTHYAYKDCHISDFYIDTLYDKNKSYQKMSEFAYVDHFEFTCSGYHPIHLT